MITWRLSIDDVAGHEHDLVIEADETATVGDLCDELASRGFDRSGLGLSAFPVDETTLDDSPLLNGMHLGRQDASASTGPGWYVVAIAGPDTGAWQVVGSTAMTVGRGAHNDLPVADRSMSDAHLRVRLADGKVTIEDLGSTNGTFVEGSRIESIVTIADGTYLHAGSTTFGLVRVEPNDLPIEPPKWGPTRPFQQRFREALVPLPTTIRHPSEPSRRSDTNRRPLIAFAIPIITALGMALITGRYIFLLVIALGPVFFAIDGIRRRRHEEREQLAERQTYEAQVAAATAEIRRHRTEELRRDRWAAAPAGLAALLAAVGHQRLWERQATDDDFCEVAIGLYDAPSVIEVDGRPDGATLPFDHHWSAVLRHSLVREGALAVKGSMDRVRALGRALVTDLACAQSPNDLKLWLLTDGDAEPMWNAVRWLPHTYLNDSQSRVFASRTARAGATTALRSIINERRNGHDHQHAAVPIHVVVIDCLALLDPDEVADLLVDGATVGVVGITLDPGTTPRGASAELILGDFADEARFESRTQPSAAGVRSFEMLASRLEAPARAMAGRRPTGSQRDAVATTGVVRLVDLIGAETSVERADRIVARWRDRGPTTRVKIGGLGELDVEIDLARDGPHGLVGGTTRSGKTEFLKALFTSLAVANHPDDLSIVIVDFKGGVDHELSARLPHVVDLSTNLDVDAFVRTVQLVEAEMRRRQDQVRSIGAPNFDAYHAARADDPSLPPLPRLLVVIDEFSELLSSDEGRDNLSALESVTRVGGGLGVHLLLVTQNFENQLPSQIAANAGLRICFRVQQPAHSKAVLDSDEAATIPKERIGRAFLRSHRGPAVEFQGARVAGPLPGHEKRSPLVRVRAAPFTTLADTPPEERIVDVKAEHTDMWAVVDVIRSAAAASGWTQPAVPWPRALPVQLSVGAVLEDELGVDSWPVGLVDEPDRQRTSVLDLQRYGPSALLIGGPAAGLADVVRGAVVTGALRAGPDQFQAYVIDLAGQGLSTLGDLPHVGGVAERNEPLAGRIIRHTATEVARRKAALSEMGFSNVSEPQEPSRYGFADLVLVVNGADRLVGSGDADQSPLLGPLLSTLAESFGSGVRVLLAGGPAMVHRRLGSAVGRRFVFRCADPQVYGTLGVPKEFHSQLGAAARAVDVNHGRLVQFGLVPSKPDAPPSEIVRALGHRLNEAWEGSPDRLPLALRELAWPLPIAAVGRDRPGPEVHQPVALAVDTEQGALAWLDAEEDGPIFVVTGTTRSGRSSALLAAATLMADNGWTVVGLPVSRRSPMAAGKFPGPVIEADHVHELAGRSTPTALFVDDIHKWSGDPASLADFAGGRDRSLIVAGSLDFLRSRNDVTRILNTRSALVLCPGSSRDADQYGIPRLPDEVLRDKRPGRGTLAISGEVLNAQVPWTG